MPNYQMIADKANSALSLEGQKRAGFSAGYFAPGFTLGSALLNLQLIDANDPVESRFVGVLNQLPDGAHEAIRAAIYSAVSRATPISVQTLWLPGAGWEVTVSEAIAADGVTNAMSILIRTPYELPPSGKGAVPGAK